MSPERLAWCQRRVSMSLEIWRRVIALSIVQHWILWSKVSSPIVRNRPKNSVWNSGWLCQSLPHWRHYWRACFSRHLPLHILRSIPVPHSHPWAYTSNTSHSQFLSLSKGLVCGLCGWGVDRNSFQGLGRFLSRFSQGSMTCCWKVKCHLWIYIPTLIQNLVRYLCRVYAEAFWGITDKLPA